MPKKIRCSRCRTRTQNAKPSLHFVAPGVYEREFLCVECSRKRAAIIRAARAEYADRLDAVRSTLLGRVRLSLRAFIVGALAFLGSLLRKVKP